MADLLQEHRTLILQILTGLVSLVLVIVFARWFSRTRGWRRAMARRRRQFAGGVRDLGRLAAARYRFHRDVRDIARLLADPTVGPDTIAAFAAADGIAPDPGDASTDASADRAAPLERAETGPYRAVVRADVAQAHSTSRAGEVAGPALIRARIAARPSPREAAASPAPASPAPESSIGESDTVPTRGYCPVVVGLVPGARGALVLLDLVGLPAVGSIEGPPGLSRRLAATIAAQLAAGIIAGVADSPGIRLIVVDRILPGYEGPVLSDALGLLERRAAADPLPDSPGWGDGSPDDDRTRLLWPTVLVCPAPTDDDLTRLMRLVELLPDLRVVVAGRYPGPRWRLELDDLGRITAPELGLRADCAPLERGLALALRHLDRKRRDAAEDDPPPAARTDDAPVDEAPVDEAPVDEAPVDEAPVDDAPVNGTPVDDAAAPDGTAPDAAVPARSDSAGAAGGATDVGGVTPRERPEPPDAGELTEPEPVRHDDSRSAAISATGGRAAVEAGVGTAGVET